MNTITKNILRIGPFLFVVGMLICSAWYVIHGDVWFMTDIARDFHLLREIDQKKLILIGPRSSTAGLFHGPLWLYIMYPAYLIGQGNPVIVGWWWVMLIAIFLATTFFICKKLFGEFGAWVSLTFLSVQLVFESRGLFNPHGAYFFLPVWFFLFLLYEKNGKPLTLILFLLTSGVLIQFQMAIGIPLTILGMLALVWIVFRKKTYIHLMVLPIIFIPLLTFIVFEIRHGFSMTHAAITYLSAPKGREYSSLFAIIIERMGFAFSGGLGFIHDGSALKDRVAAITFFILVLLGIKEKTHRRELLWYLYFYFGFYIFSIVNKTGGMLYHYIMPVFSLTGVIVAALVTGNKRYVVVLGILVAVWINTQTVRGYIQTADGFIGVNENSWKSLYTMALDVPFVDDHDIGYFVYSPDVVGYQPKYALLYAFEKKNLEALPYVKKSVTYVVSAPAPKNNPSMADAWWFTNKMKYEGVPSDTKSFPNGFVIKRFVLTPEEQAVPSSSDIDTGIFFR